jgi:hypothetical protein
MEFSCTMCHYVSHRYSDYCNHIVRLHRNDSRFKVFCQVGQCAFSTRSWKSFKSHVCRKHGFEQLEETLVDDNELVNDEFGEENNDENDVRSMRHLNASYLLSLETTHQLSQAAVNVVAENTASLINRHLMLYKSAVREQLQMGGLDCNFLEEIEIECEMNDLNTEYKRVKFYEGEFEMICPDQVFLGSRLAKQNGTVKRVQDFGYIVPFAKLVEALYKLSDFYHWIDNHHRSDDSMIRDICDGDYIKNHPIFSRNHRALQILLYTDELEIVNPLGTHVKKHKITLFYVAFANIPPEYRSKLSCIFLLAIAKSRMIKLHGLGKLLKDFIQTVNRMSSGGITIAVNGVEHLVEGSVVMAPADTPAANVLGGFKEGVGFAYKKCRTCLISGNDIKVKFRDDSMEERTQLETMRCCEILESGMSRDAKQYWSKMWGINGKSVLSDLDDFDIIRCLVHDPMHILLEGVVKFEMALLFIHCIDQKKYFSLRWLNAQLQSFPYSYLEKSSKPEPVDRRHYFVEVTIKQTASAMLSLLCILPFILGPVIPADDNKWKTFLKLIQITLMTTSPCIVAETVQDLRNLIEDHHMQFKLEYPKASITPKLHFMCHLPKQLQDFGPGRFQWCMRFEAKHAFFKNKKWKSMKNLPLSMARFHQKFLCRQMTSSVGQPNGNFLYSGDEVREGREVPIDETSAEYRDCLLPIVPNIQSVFLTKECVIHGCTYKHGCILVLSYSEDDFPTFGYLLDILVTNQEKMFFVKRGIVVNLHQNAVAYEVDFTGRTLLVDYHDICVKMPLSAHLLRDKSCIINKYGHMSIDIV